MNALKTFILILATTLSCAAQTSLPIQNGYLIGPLNGRGNMISNASYFGIFPISGGGVITNADGSLTIPGGSGSGSPANSGTNITVTTVTVGTNTYAFVNLNPSITLSNVTSTSFIGGGYGLFNTPLNALNPFGAPPGIVENNGSQFIVVPASTRFILTNGVGQFTNGACVILTPFANETNSIFVCHHTISHTGNMAAVDFWNVTNGVSFTAYSSNPNDSDFVDWMIVNGGGVVQGQIFSVTTIVPNGTASPSSTIVNTGGSATIVVNPTLGYYAAAWVSNGVEIGPISGNVFTVSNITTNVVINVITPPIFYTVTTSAGANGSITPTGSYPAGSTVTITASPNVGYFPSVWTLDGVAVQTNSITFAIPYILTNHTVSITFAPVNTATNVFNGQIAWYTFADGIASSNSIIATNYAKTSWYGHTNLYLANNGNPYNHWGGNGGLNNAGFGYFFSDGYFAALGTDMNGFPQAPDTIVPPFTYTAWVWFTNTGNNWREAIIAGNNYQFPELYITENGYPAFYSFGDVNAPIISGTQLSTNYVNYVAFTLDTNYNYNFYVGGVGAGSGVAPHYNFKPANIQIGEGDDGYALVGGLANINIFNRVLSQSEITNIVGANQ